ncbi:MAG TPA: hypothetical protein VHR41_05390 [Gemmatimonadales bacterium]|jgi:hypothetical protein|nr:hypothetical protein [Gemmatimonadales bacterium]
MNDPSRWSFDQDPPRDAALERLLRAADRPAPGADVDWERMHAAILRGVHGAAAPREWWDVVVQWRRAAVAAGVAALAAGALLWRAEAAGSDLALADAAPESVALAQVVAAYPDDAVLTSLVQGDGNDEFTSWGVQ